MANKELTINTYLKNIENKKLKELIKWYHLNNISIDMLFKVFEELEHTPTSVANFIMDDNNSFELSVFSYRANGYDKYYAYNGKNYYQGQICTLGASHSRYHG